ncbi:hypothetical protein EJB05_10893, partial [Eragrostis curvula]
MDEQEFRRMLDLFPVVRSRDYCADPGTSSRGTTHQARSQETTKGYKKDSSGAEGIYKIEDVYNELVESRIPKLCLIGATKAEFFCKAFEEAHEKLIYRELSLDAAENFLNAKKSKLDFKSTILRQENSVTLFQGNRDQLAVLVTLARANSHHFTRVQLHSAEHCQT